YAHGGRHEVNDALERFGAQARDWYAYMQQVAARFAGREHSAGDIARAWKEALGASGANPFPELLRSMRGHGLAGLDQWVEDAAPWLEAVRAEGMSWLRIPAFGAGREHQERAQALARALVEYEEANSAYNALLSKATQQAFVLFEDRLTERAEPGRQVESARALFDLWIDAAEEAYAEVALSPEFRRAYGRLVDAQMRVRAGVQQQVEQLRASLGMPTRTEVDSAHRRIVELERALRRLRDAVEGGASPAAAAPDAGGRAAGRSAGRGGPAAKKAAPARPAAAKPAPPQGKARKAAAAGKARKTPVAKAQAGRAARSVAPGGVAAEAVRFQRKLAAGLQSLREVGGYEYGATGKEEVWRDGKVVLYRYAGAKAPTAKVPVLISYALVNRPYMVDLQENRSLVRGLLERGEDVYIIDWGYPDRSDRFLTLEDYIERFLGGAVDELRRRHRLDAINLLGICQGGAFALTYAALHPEKIRNLITMVTPV